MTAVVISGTGLFVPPFTISNAELVESLTASVEQWNAEHAEGIADGSIVARQTPDEEFIVKASGIR